MQINFVYKIIFQHTKTSLWLLKVEVKGEEMFLTVIKVRTR